MAEIRPTQKPVPSNDIKDLLFNSGLVDEWATSLEKEYIDRFGVSHLTAAGMEWAFKQLVEKFNISADEAIRAAGYILLDSFQQGVKLTNNELTLRNQALRDERTGEYYRWNGALPKPVPAGSTPESTGGIGASAWVGVGDAAIRSELISGDGTLVGTNHRGKLQTDLIAMDRRPDGYGDSISAVLASGLDVEINKNYTISAPITPSAGQYIRGAGGSVKQTASTSAGIRVEGDSSTTKNWVTIESFKSSGSALSSDPGNEAYAAFLRRSKFTRINGVIADNYTGGVAIGNSDYSFIRDVIGYNTTFHPLNENTRDGRGGYGVITDNLRHSVINGVILEASGLNNGRHVLYVSTGGYGEVTGNRGFIASQLIGKYTNKDDRNFWGVNTRMSSVFILGETIIDGANSGVAYNANDGDVTDFITHAQQLDIIKYADGVTVYGISAATPVYVGARYLISNFNVRVRPKNTSLTGADCVAVQTSYQNGMVANGVTNVPAASSPILIGDGANNTTFSNIHDNIIPGYSGDSAAMFAFTGNGVTNVTIRGITTSRKMFNRITVATDVTVDFPRQARILLASGVASLVDNHELISSVSVGATSITVFLHKHVTQVAADTCAVRMLLDNGIDGYIMVRETTGKAINIRFYNSAGAVQNPSSASALGCMITIYR